MIEEFNLSEKIQYRNALGVGDVIKVIRLLKELGFKAEKISDVLDLDKEDWLKRRLQSILTEKKLAKIKEARQLIVHKHVVIDGKIVNIPGYMVRMNEENKIEVRRKK